MWTQIIGKIQLALAAPVNHWWHIAQHVTSRGLSTGPLPDADRRFQVDVDLVQHVCEVRVSDGTERHIALRPMTVAQFHDELSAALDALGIRVDFWRQPVEVQEPIRFDEDHMHRSYDADQVTRFFHALAGADRILERFRGEFIGKSSPVHFFWGSFDLACSRFSGRPAPPHSGGMPNLADWVTREAYSHEVFSVGWWPGNEAYPRPAFYAYAYPEPPGFAEARIPAGASYEQALGEFVLPCAAPSGDGGTEAEDVLAFLRAAYSAAADLGGWDRAALEAN